MWEASTKGHFIVRAQCSAPAPGATVSYVVLDASPPATLAERRLGTGKVGCDGKLTDDGAPPLVGKIQIRLSDISPRVTGAYAVVVPE